MSTYYSVVHGDIADRSGRGVTPSWRAWQRDWALTLRLDLGESWLAKLEGHLVDGAAGVSRSLNPGTDFSARYWAYGIVKVSVWF